MQEQGEIFAAGGGGPGGGQRAGHVPVIAVTANVRDEQIAVARHCGMDDVVSKPFRISDLIQRIEALLAATTRGCDPLTSSFHPPVRSKSAA